MTSFDAERAARGWGLIAEGAMELSLAYAAIEQPGAEAAPSPWVKESDLPRPPLKPQVDAGLGLCPVHGVPWTVKEAGVSKAGKKYRAFWKCAVKDEDGFCDERPQPIWQDAHPADAAA